MSDGARLGRVASLFDHVKQNWCEEFFDEMYIHTNGDCIEDIALTETECNQLENISSIKHMLQDAAAHGEVGRPVLSILDLCCGQGRHSIALAKKYPRVEVLGVDQSEYLIDLARQRSQAQHGLSQVKFEQSDARQIPASDDAFDLVIVMGHSLGCLDESEGATMMKEIRRVLKPGGSVVIEIPDRTRFLDKFSPSGWEWLSEPKLNSGGSDDNDTAGLGQRHASGRPVARELIACRERELSEDKKYVASREIVIDILSGSVLRDQFYVLRLYSLDELAVSFADCGLQMLPDESRQQLAPQQEGTGDAHMLQARQLVVAVKQAPPAALAAPQPMAHVHDVPAVNAQDVHVFIHPYLQQGHDTVKGKTLQASKKIQGGTILMADVPYAMVPNAETGTSFRPICSNIYCRRLISANKGTRCPRNCTDRVVWCDDNCKAIGETYHAMECFWLREKSELLRLEKGEYDFALLWIVVRLFIGRRRERLDYSGEKMTCSESFAWENRFKRGWQSFGDCRSNLELWPEEQLVRWRRLIELYMTEDVLTALQTTAEEALTVLCQEETNSFLLHDGITGIFPIPDKPQLRGKSYASAVYPRACGFNHSCMPNVFRRPDEQGRMVFTASRDIAEGEECVISYFDLAEHVDVDSRQKLLGEWFRFTCSCARCEEDSLKGGAL